MIRVIKVVSTILVAVVVSALVSAVTAEALFASRRLAFGILLAPPVSWALAFFGNSLGEALGFPRSDALDMALRYFGLFVLAAMALLIGTVQR